MYTLITIYVTLHLYFKHAIAQRSPTCGIVKCFPNGMFYGCAFSEFSCICTKEQRYITEYINAIAPCVENQTECTRGGVWNFMSMFQQACTMLEKPITSLPSRIDSFLIESYATGHVLTSTSSTTTAGMGSVTATVSDTTPATTATSAPSPTSMGAPTGVGTQDAPVAGGLSLGATIGVAVGSGCVVIVIAGISCLWVWKRRRARPSPSGLPEPVYVESKPKGDVPVRDSALTEKTLVELE